VSNRGWKLCCAGLLALTLYAYRPHDDDHATSPSSTRSDRAALTGPLRLRPAALGTTRDLVDRLLTERDLADVQRLAVQLGAVGDDRAIDGVVSLLDDPRPGVPAAILEAFGEIGTAHAAEVILPRAADHAYEARDAAVSALGKTQQPGAEKLLVEIAGQSNDTTQATAIYALGPPATDGAVTALERLALRTRRSALS